MSEAMPPPNNLEAEQAVLGAMLIDPDAFYKVDMVLTLDDFYLERHRWLYEAYAHLAEKRVGVDLVTLAAELERRGHLVELGGSAYMVNLINATPTALNVEYYAVIVERAAVRRRLSQAGAEITLIAQTSDAEDPTEVIQAAQAALVLAIERKRDGSIITAREAGADYYDHVVERHEAGKAVIGLPTGFSTLDRMLYGLLPTRFYTLAGRPGMGKTALALAITLNVAKIGKHVAVFSFEMGAEQLFNRWVSMVSGIDSARLFTGQLKDHEWPAFTTAVEEVSESGIYIADTGATLAGIVSKSRVLHMRYGLDLIVVDYLQLMSDAGGGRKNSNRENEVGRISRGMKGLAMEMHIPILAVAQLNRGVEQRKDKHPMLSDLRESGTLEQDSDVVMTMYRDDYYDPDTETPNIVDLDVLKWRDGPIGRIVMYYVKEQNQFHEAEVIMKPLEGFSLGKDEILL